MISSHEQVIMQHTPNTDPSPFESAVMLSREQEQFMGSAVLASLAPEVVAEGSFAETTLPSSERLGVPLHEYAGAYLERILVDPGRQGIPDEAASFRHIQATDEQRRIAREIVVAACVKSQIEQMSLPLVRLGDLETLRHEIRVGALLALADMGQTAVDAGLIHDDGKVFVLDVINKRGKLTDTEKEKVKLHVKGTLVLAGLAGITDRQVLVNVNMHHGGSTDPATNYVGSEELLPDSEESRMEAMLVKIVDEFDALSGERGYKPALPLNEALPIMERQIAAPQTAWDRFYRLIKHPDKQVD